MISLISGGFNSREGSILFGEGGSKSLDHLFSLFSVLSVGFFVGNDVLEVYFTANHISGGHNVVQVNVFHERFDGCALLDFLRPHFFGHLSRVSLQACHQGVGEFSFLE